MKKSKFNGLKIVRKWRHPYGFIDNIDFVGMLADGSYIVVNVDGGISYHTEPGFYASSCIENACDLVKKGIWVEVQ